MLIEKIQEFRASVAGERVFILGGGPSVTEPVLALLNSSKHKTLCINSSCEFISNPYAVMWCDESWSNKNADWLTRYDGWKFSVKNEYLAKNYFNKDVLGQFKSIPIGKSGDNGFDERFEYVRGNNTGTNAINFLINCGVSSIGLVGMDMGMDGGKTHFHTKYSFPIKKEIYSNIFLPSIQSMACELDKLGKASRIYNCSKYSRITNFEYKQLKDLI